VIGRFGGIFLGLTVKERKNPPNAERERSISVRLQK
jgi:hypothetical protein